MVGGWKHADCFCNNPLAAQEQFGVMNGLRQRMVCSAPSADGSTLCLTQYAANHFCNNPIAAQREKRVETRDADCIAPLADGSTLCWLTQSGSPAHSTVKVSRGT